MAQARGRVLVFDSGIGGLGIVRALRDTLPGARIDYLADTALFPYGEQPDDILTTHIVQTIRLATADSPPDVVVIACNTASTLALPALRARLPIPIVGCVPPVRWAARLSRTRTIGLLATSATVRRPYVAALQARFAPDCALIMHGARHLADLAERAFIGDAIDETLVGRELDALLDRPGGDAIDVIGLGCTHYSVLLPWLQAAAAGRGRQFTWLDPAPAVARHAASIFQVIGPGASTDARAERVTLTARAPRPEDLSRALAMLGYPALPATDLLSA